MENKKYFDNLDGLRAYAALAVVVFHQNVVFGWYWEVMPYWWLWVQVFFVISGFLITNILLNIKDTGNYFWYFYGRRAVRILPLYFFCLFLSIIYWVYENLSIKDVYAYILFIQNWVIWINNWVVEFPSIFWHSWTLAIEQQFYILWPLFIRYVKVDKLMLICVLWIILSIFSRFYSAEFYPWYMTAYSTLSHIDTLLWWSLLWILYHQKDNLKALFKYNFLLVGLIFIAYYLITKKLGIATFWEKDIRSNESEWPITMLILSPLCVLLVHYLLISKNLITRWIFWNRCIVHLWKISYGIYLYHVFVINIFQYEGHTMLMIRKSAHLFLVHFFAPFVDNIGKLANITLVITSFWAFILQIIIIIIISHISYTYFEKRFLGKKNEKKL